MNEPSIWCTVHRIHYAITCPQCEPAVVHRRIDITPKQRELLRHLLAGLSGQACAERMGLAEGTMKIHRNGLYRRLGVRSRDELMAKLMRPTHEAVRLMEGR